MDYVTSLIANIQKTTLLSATTAKGQHTVGSTSALVGAYVFDLDEKRMFVTTPMPNRLLSIVELVAEVSTITQKQAKTKGFSTSGLRPLPTTIIITPYVLEESTEDNTIILLRFYHFVVDAKSTMFYIIYKELANACGAKAGDAIKFFQILPLLIPEDGAQTWVMNILVPINHSVPTAVERTVMLDFGGIHCMLMTGLTYWAPSMKLLLLPSSISNTYCKSLEYQSLTSSVSFTPRPINCSANSHEHLWSRKNS